MASRQNIAFIEGLHPSDDAYPALLEETMVTCSRFRGQGQFEHPNTEIAGRLRHVWSAAGHYMSRDRLAALRDMDASIAVFGAGPNDNLVHHDNALPLAAALDAKLHVYEDSGHVLHCGKSKDAFLQDLRNFIIRRDATQNKKGGGSSPKRKGRGKKRRSG